MVGYGLQIAFRSVLALACGVGLAAKLRAENPLAQVGQIAAENAAVEAAEKLTDPSEVELGGLVKQLASSEFAQRRQAFLKLWGAGKLALPLIVTAKSSDERRVVEAAMVLEILIDLDIAPERLQESARLLDALGNPTPQTILELCTLKYWTVAQRVLAGNPQLVRQLQDSYGRYLLCRVVDAAVEQEQVALAWPIIRQVVSPAQAVFMAHKTGFELERSDPYSTAQRLYFEGDVDAALKVKVPLVVQVPMLTRTGRWERMTDESVVAILAGRESSPSQLAAQAVLNEVAGKYSRATELWNEILRDPNPRDTTQPNRQSDPLPVDEVPVDEVPVDEAPVDKAPVDEAPVDEAPVDLTEVDRQTQLAVNLLETIDQGGFGGQAHKNQLIAALLFSGRVKPVEEYLKQYEPDAAFGFFLAGNQQSQALEAIGVNADLSNLDEWFLQRKLLITEQLGQRAIEDSHFDQCARLTAILADLGYRQQAQKMLSELVELTRQSRTKQTELWSRSLLPWLARSETRQMALQAAMDEFPRMSNELQAAVMKGLFPALDDAALAVWKTAPAEDEAGKWSDLQRLYLLDRSAWGRDYSNVVKTWLRRALKLLSNDPLTSEQLTKIADVANGYGEMDLAVEILMTDLSPGYGRSSSANLHWSEAARIMIERGKPEAALPLLSAVRRTGVNPQHVYVEEVHAVMLSGQFELGRTLAQSRWLRPLATSARYQGYNYFFAAREFVQAEQYARGEDYAEAAFMLSDLASIDGFWAASVYGDVLEQLGKHERRADVLRGAWVEALQPFSSSMQTMIGEGYYSGLRFSAQKEKLARAIACIEQQDWQGFQHTVKVARQLQSQDIEVVCQCYRRLRDAGKTELAEQLLADYEREMELQLQRWPQDSTALNNLAWMYSQCDVKLERASELSHQAIELAPSSAIFLDTLAEIEFRAGDIASAVETMRECVRLDPRESHYRENLVRFRQSSTKRE